MLNTAYAIFYLKLLYYQAVIDSTRLAFARTESSFEHKGTHGGIKTRLRAGVGFALDADSALEGRYRRVTHDEDYETFRAHIIELALRLSVR